jgi:hypothetical protein
MKNSMQIHNAVMGVSCDAPQHLRIDSIIIRAKDVKMVAQGVWEREGKNNVSISMAFVLVHSKGVSRENC